MIDLDKNINRRIEKGADKPSIKEGVNFVFEQNPKLGQIGTKEQYSKYLDAIFPESKVKGKILYHGGNEGIENFDNTKYNIRLGRDKEKRRYGLAHYFAGDIKHARGFGQQMYCTLLNMVSPKIVRIGYDNYGEVADIDQAKLDQLEKEGHDSIIGIAAEGDEVLKRAHPDEYVVFKAGQVHILGSEADMERFREFVEKNKK